MTQIQTADRRRVKKRQIEKHIDAKQIYYLRDQEIRKSPDGSSFTRQHYWEHKYGQSYFRYVKKMAWAKRLFDKCREEGNC